MPAARRRPSATANADSSSQCDYSVVLAPFSLLGLLRLQVRFKCGSLRRAEVHWYEAHGVGKRGLKIKRFLD